MGRLKKISDLSTTSRRHVVAVYLSSKENRGEGRIIVFIASLETIRILVRQGFELVTENTFVKGLDSELKVKEQVTMAEDDNEIQIE